ncbi:AAA family ATPase [Desulfovibrio sp. OttesenSCG-928-A18]|nr:AAA family ATPase [Desulfovibrio sp. OttesenSCG-928-A18]
MVKNAEFFSMEFPVFLNNDPAIPLVKTMEGFDHNAFAGGTGRILLPFSAVGLRQDILAEIWSEVAARPGSAMRIDDAPVAWDEVKTALRAQACAEGYTGPSYCVPRQGWDWGCVFLSHVLPQESDGHIECPALKNRLVEEAQRLWLPVCPHFSQERVHEKTGVHCRNANLELLQRDEEKKRRMLTAKRAQHRPDSLEQIVQPARYADIGGLDDVVLALREAIELPLKHPEVLERLGISPPKGCIMHGPPGCGKTLLARAVATESEAAFIPVSGPELVTKWHGESEERLREVFQRAQKAQPAIIFFDEIDAIAQSRSASESLRFDTKFTTQLLTLMDGIYDLGMVFVLAATNRLDLLDPALLRPGRFDAVITIPKPDLAGCKSILSIHAARVPLSPKVNLSAIAERLSGFTGAEIALLVREAALICMRRAFPLADLLRQRESVSQELLKKLVHPVKAYFAS